MKCENWNGHNIRFVQINNEWWAILSDIADALGLEAKQLRRRLNDEVLLKHLVADSLGRKNHALLVSEYGIYDAIFTSRKPEAKEFKHWVFNVIKQLRQSAGVEGFQVFRTLDKQYQKEAMNRLTTSLKSPKKVDYIKANIITDKAISNKHGYSKLVKKNAMTPEMLSDRQPILSETVNLMAMKEKFGLDFHVSKAIYKFVDKKHG